MTEEVTNLIAKLREHAAFGMARQVIIPRDLISETADALERSTAETREAQATLWDEMIRGSQSILVERVREIAFDILRDEPLADLAGVNQRARDQVNPYRPVSSVVAEDPKPLDPHPWRDHDGRKHAAFGPKGHPSMRGSYWSPDPQFEQDESRYGVTPKAGA